MRRIILAACAVVLLHAAPSMAAECTNLALARNGGVAIGSSHYPGYWVSAVTDGVRQTSAGSYWNDGDQNVWPDWVGVSWRDATTLDRIVLRGPVWATTAASGIRTLARTRVQYYDDATATWVDVIGRSGQANPILDWTMPTASADGSEIRQFDFSAVTTRRIRALVEQGAGDGWSFMEEIEAYDSSDCEEPAPECSDIALDGTASASSVHSSGLYPAGGVNNGRAESGASKGYWNDDTNGAWPDWVQIAWVSPRLVNRISARIPLAETGFPSGEITLRRTRIQYWDDATSSWIDVSGRSDQPNPIVDWTGPIGGADGSETKSFDFAAVRTSKIRALIEDGSTDGWSWLDELQAYYGDCATAPEPPRGTNLALASNGGIAIGSSHYPGYGVAAVTDGVRQTSAGAYWNDLDVNVWPDWVGVAWRDAVTIDRIVLRGPVWATSAAAGVRTLARARVQYWDATAEQWVDVTGRSGQDNPIVDWLMPLSADGTEVKQFDFAQITTTRVRALIENGSTDGWSFMEEFEAWRIS